MFISFRTGSLIGLMLAAPAFVAAADAGAVAKVSIASGPYAGAHKLESGEACSLRSLQKGDPVFFNGIFVREDGSDVLGGVTVLIPNVDAKHLNELFVEIVIDPPSNKSRKARAADATFYRIDTRPDSSLARYELEERGAGKLTGKGSATLRRQAATATVQFTAETAKGVKLSGTIECLKVEG